MTSRSDQSSEQTAARALETFLRSHSCVRQAAAGISKNTETGEERLVGHVVADERQLERLFGGPEEERKRANRWRKMYDLTQFAKETKSFPPGLNIGGWNSTYNRQPIPAEQMRDWVELTVKRISALNPRKVLEIGCGTGMLLLRLAPQCERYVAMDFAPSVLQKVRDQMAAIGGTWDGVTLLERAADNFEGLAENSFDTVVINSVTQHFPSRDYLLRVLESAARLLQPGGRMFVGDNRNLALLEPFALSVELFQAAPTVTVGELRSRVARRILLEDQLVLSPAYFVALQKCLPKVSHVALQPKPGRLDNEMNRYRFDAVLHFDVEEPKFLEPAWMDWHARGLTLQSVEQILQTKQPEALAIQAIRNARVEKDMAAVAWLAAAAPSSSVEELQKSLAHLKGSGVDPSDLAALAEKWSYRLDIGWAAARADGSFDAVFRKIMQTTTPLPEIRWPQPAFPLDDLSLLSNAPGQAVRREQFVQQLLEAWRQQLPEGAPSIELFVVDQLPVGVAAEK